MLRHLAKVRASASGADIAVDGPAESCHDLDQGGLGGQAVQTQRPQTAWKIGLPGD
jgi:hypothetical protein